MTSSTRRRHLKAARTVYSVLQKPTQNHRSITSTDDDFVGTDPNQDDPMVISVELANFMVKKTLVDQGSSTDVLYYITIKNLGIPETEVKEFGNTLVGFAGEHVETRGYVKLLTKLGNGTASRTISVKFIIVDAPRAAYNLILVRPSLNELGAIVSTPHLTMKFHSISGEVISIRADQRVARQCYVDSLKVNFKEREELTEKKEEVDVKKKSKLQVT